MTDEEILLKIWDLYNLCIDIRERNAFEDKKDLPRTEQDLLKEKSTQLGEMMESFFDKLRLYGFSSFLVDVFNQQNK